MIKAKSEQYVLKEKNKHQQIQTPLKLQTIKI